MQQAAPLVVAAFCRGWIGIGKVIGVTNRADRINVTAHLQGLALGGSQGEINGRSRAVGRWCGGIGTWLGPERQHLLFGDSRLRTGVIHHELLHGQGPEGIKDQQLQRFSVIPQHLLRLQQALQL